MESKRINKRGMIEVIDSVRTACLDIQRELEKMNPDPKKSTKIFVSKHNIHEMTNNLFVWLEEFKDDKIWDVRDDNDAFDK